MTQLPILMAYMAAIVSMISNGKTTWAKLRDLLTKAGATNDELQALDLQLSAAIDRRESELPTNPAA